MQNSIVLLPNFFLLLSQMNKTTPNLSKQMGLSYQNGISWSKFTVLQFITQQLRSDWIFPPFDDIPYEINNTLLLRGTCVLFDTKYTVYVYKY